MPRTTTIARATSTPAMTGLWIDRGLFRSPKPRVMAPAKPTAAAAEMASQIAGHLSPVPGTRRIGAGTSVPRVDETKRSCTTRESA
jgi:hypothetical protein